MSAADQLEAAALGCIDLETPDSILVGTNLRDLLNRHTFSLLPPLYQYKLIQLLPNVDRPAIDSESPTIRLNSSSLNNEFFARACLEWPERLKEGEFTPENQLKLRSEADKEKSKLDPWKLKHFEPIWGVNGQSSQKLANKTAKVSAAAKPMVAAQTITAPAATSTAAAAKQTDISPAVVVKEFESPPTVPAAPAIKEPDTKKTNTDSATTAAELNVTPITTTTTIAYTTPSSLSPSSNTGTSYTTSSGRLIKSPSSYSSLTYAQQQKRQRTVGAVTRSSASTSTTVVVPQPPASSDNLAKVSYSLNVYGQFVCFKYFAVYLQTLKIMVPIFNI